MRQSRDLTLWPDINSVEDNPAPTIVYS